MNQKITYEEERWITQKPEDINLVPSGCAYCGCLRLLENKQGWFCNDCGMEINAVSYYQGANGKAKQIKEEDKNGRIK